MDEGNWGGQVADCDVRARSRVSDWINQSQEVTDATSTRLTWMRQVSVLPKLRYPSGSDPWWGFNSY